MLDRRCVGRFDGFGRFWEGVIFWIWCLGVRSTDEADMDILSGSVFRLEFMMDGIRIRKIFYGSFIRSTDSQRRGAAEVEDMGAWPVSVLEILVALADRFAEDVMGDDPDRDIFKKLFWQMLTNLGIMRFKGTRLDKGRICTIIEIWISRDFEPDGGGSPFPLKNPPADQRRVEIWNQICHYIDEHPEFRIE